MKPYTDARMGAQIQTHMYMLLLAGILNRNPGIGCFSHLTHYKLALKPFFLPLQILCSLYIEILF